MSEAMINLLISALGDTLIMVFASRPVRLPARPAARRRCT